MNNIQDDNLRLTPDPNEKFGLSAKLKRSALLDNEGSEYDEYCIALAEGDAPNIGIDSATQHSAALYSRTKLRPDIHTHMPGKDKLKRAPRKHTLQTAMRYAAIFVAILALGFAAYNVMQRQPATNVSGNNSTAVEITPTPVKQPDTTQPAIKNTPVDDKAIAGLPAKTTKPIAKSNRANAIKKISASENIEQAHNEEEDISPVQNKQPLREQLTIARIEPLTPTQLTNATDPSIIKGLVAYNAEEQQRYADANSEPWAANLLKKLITRTDKEKPTSVKGWINQQIQSGIENIGELTGNGVLIVLQYDENGVLISRSVESGRFKHTSQYAQNSSK